MTGSSPLLVLGVDPGLGITGYGAVRLQGRRPALVEAGVFRSDTKLDMADRLVRLHDEFARMIADIAPDVVAVEDIHARPRFPKTSIIMAHARGVLLLAAASAGLAVHTYTASRVKQAVSGNGRADKEQVARSVVNALSLRETPKPDDVTDALAIALCHANAIYHGSLHAGAGDKPRRMQ